MRSLVSVWTIDTGMKNDSALYNAVDIAGAHYPCGGISAMTTCTSTTDAQTLLVLRRTD